MLEQIQTALHAFADGDLTANALNLFKTLGYESDRRIDFDSKSAANFLELISEDSNFNRKNAAIDDWNHIDMLFQLTDSELKEQSRLFDTDKSFNERYPSYLFFAIELSDPNYSRTKLSQITREVNKVFALPVMVLFKYGEFLTLAVISRQPHKRDEAKDVLRKVTLIKDINFRNTHAAHRQILRDLSQEALGVKRTISTFADLYLAWQEVLDTKELNKRFFKELANWYFWSVERVEFPDDEEKNDEIRNATNVIRLITRLIFVWFLKEKGLVSEKLFNEKYLKNILRFEGNSTFYRAILQNLFFATLNSAMGKRTFRRDSFQGKSPHFGVHNVFRYRSEFVEPDGTIKELFEPIPFLNGGLFECLDKPELNIRVDGFSDRADNVLEVPHELFFGEEREIDLNDVYGTTNKRYKVRGLINILKSYKFTIAENTPIEEEIALDPELLGRVFENLLANFNPETKKTARKKTGSFYTPREIVNYMVDESLISYLKTKLQTETTGFGGYIAFGENQTTMFGNEGRIQQKFETPISSNRWDGKPNELEGALRGLFGYTEELHKFNQLETEILIKAIDNCKILDPACGSGAFPMGILHRLVNLLTKLDKDNSKWKQWQKQKALDETEKAYEIGDVKEREVRLIEINQIFEDNSDDYGRKLFLIENCIYGVDIQPIAIQIAKLRFFISLIVDQLTNPEKPNLGIRPLPNLETKFVAANTLFGLGTVGLKPSGITDLERDLKQVRAKHFSARTRRTKQKYREKDKEIRNQIADILKASGFPTTSADQISSWDPYDQNAKADWFDAEWMFGVYSGFEIVIGNPPWGAELSADEKSALRSEFSEIDSSTPNSFAYFLGVAFRLYSHTVSYVLPDSILIKDFAKCRRLISPNIEKVNWYQNIGLPEDLRPFVYVEHDVCVIQFRKEHSQSFMQTLFQYDVSSRSILETTRNVTKSDVIRKEFDHAINLLLTKADLTILDKMHRQQPLNDFMQCHEGIHTGNSRDLLFHEDKINSHCKPLFFGGGAGDAIENYVSKRSGWFVDYRREIVDNEDGRYASLRDERIFSLPKIYLTRTGNPFKAFLDTHNYASNNFFSLQFKDYGENQLISLKVILPFIVSPVAQYFIRRFAAPRLGNTFVETKIVHLLKLTIPKLDSAESIKIADLVDRIIVAKNENFNADTKSIVSEINNLIYQLYGFDHNEIRIVEGD